MIRRPPRSTRVRSSAASDVYKRQGQVASSYYFCHWALLTPLADSIESNVEGNEQRSRNLENEETIIACGRVTVWHTYRGTTTIPSLTPSFVILSRTCSLVVARGLSKHGHRVEANASARMRLSGGMCASLCGSAYGQVPARICAIHARSSGNARVSLRRHASGCIRLRDRDTCGHNARSWAEAGEYTCVCVAGDAPAGRHVAYVRSCELRTCYELYAHSTGTYRART